MREARLDKIALPRSEALGTITLMIVGGRGHKVRKNSTREIESTSPTTLSQSWDGLVIVLDIHLETKGTRGSLKL